jgi:pyruvate/oxaloacetate carboxyltransferase
MSKQEINPDCERMSNILENKNIDLEVYRKLIKNYIDLVNNISESYDFAFSFLFLNK